MKNLVFSAVAIFWLLVTIGTALDYITMANMMGIIILFVPVCTYLINKVVEQDK